MAATESIMVSLGTPAPDFDLPDVVSGRSLRLADVRGEKATVVMFICNHCPYVVHVRHELARIGADYMSRGVGVVAISSNDVDAYPQDSPERMREFALANGFAFPYLYDASQDVARAYNAACTPDVYLFDAGLELVYRGQLDGSRPGNNIPVNGADLRAALDAVLSGTPVNPNQTPSIGCNIKWRR